jgi:hypothetical protein
LSSIPIKVMLHGLIALIPSVGNNGVNHMTALLLDAREEPPMESCLSTHSPRLAFMVHDNDPKCFAAGCDLTGNDCVCTGSLDKLEISLDVSPTPRPTSQDLTAGIPHGLPETRAEARNFSYVPNVSRPPFGIELDPAYLTSSPPSNLFARMDFDFNSISACALFKREDAGIFNIHEVSFRKIHKEGAIGDTSQAIAQMVMARVDVPDGGGNPQKVVLNLKDRTGQIVHSFELMPESDGYMIELTNAAVALRPDAPCDDGVGRHFALFYKFAKNPPIVADRLIPHLRPTRWIDSEGLTPDECRMPIFNPIDRPMCPMASFDHP